MLKEITSPITQNLTEFNQVFANAMHSDSALLDKIVNYILKNKGKQLRPILVLLSAGLVGNINKSTYTAATLIELLHTATLIHDDVVDESDMRRGVFSINALWKNKIAVLVGDYLLSKGLLVALQNKEINILEIVSDAVKNMSEGELMQMKKARMMNINEEEYLTIICKKTASLLAACCASGAASAGADEETIKKLKSFGQNLGIAFQIKDDLLDFDTTNKTGKPFQNDLKGQQFSLPLIFTLNNIGFLEKQQLLRIVKNKKNNKEKINKLIERIRKEKGFDYAEMRMNEYKQKALDIINEFPQSEYKKSLISLVNFSTSRNF